MEVRSPRRRFEKTEQTYQNDTATPNIYLSASVQSITNNKFWRRVTRATTARLHEIASSETFLVLEVESFALDELFVANPVLLLFVQFIVGVESVGKAKVGDNDVLVAIQEQVLKLEITVNNTLLVQVSDTRDQLSEEPPRGRIFEVSVVQDVIEELTSGCVFQDDSHVSFSLNELVQSNNIRVLELFENRDLTVNLG